MLPGETILSGADYENYSCLQVMQSAAGYYIGTVYHDDGYDCPGSRESGYFQTKEEAQNVLDTWIVATDLPVCFSMIEYWRRLRDLYSCGLLPYARH